MSTTDAWQLAIGMMVLLDTLFLIYKWRVTGETQIIGAILPRVYYGILSIMDGVMSRTSMEPFRMLNFLGIVLIFFTANVSHIAELRRGIK